MRNAIQMGLKWLFFQKLTKIARRLGVSVIKKTENSWLVKLISKREIVER